MCLSFSRGGCTEDYFPLSRSLPLQTAPWGNITLSYSVCYSIMALCSSSKSVYEGRQWQVLSGVTVIIVSAFQRHVVLLFEIQLDCKNDVLSLNQFSALVTVENLVYCHKTSWKKGGSAVILMGGMSLVSLCLFNSIHAGFTGMMFWSKPCSQCICINRVK